MHIASFHRKLKLPCVECGKTFGARELLRNHMSTAHTARHQCHLCDKSFSLKHDLMSHVRGVHDGIKHRCTVCEKAFSRISDRNRHEREQHGFQTHSKGTLLKTVVEAVPPPPSSHKCHLCQKSFRLKNDLSSHVRGDHEAAAKVRCFVCGKEFDQISYRNRHERERHGVRAIDKLKMNSFSLKLSRTVVDS